MAGALYASPEEPLHVTRMRATVLVRRGPHQGAMCCLGPLPRQRGTPAPIHRPCGHTLRYRLPCRHHERQAALLLAASGRQTERCRDKVLPGHGCACPHKCTGHVGTTQCDALHRKRHAAQTPGCKQPSRRNVRQLALRCPSLVGVWVFVSALYDEQMKYPLQLK